MLQREGCTISNSYSIALARVSHTGTSIHGIKIWAINCLSHTTGALAPDSCIESSGDVGNRGLNERSSLKSSFQGILSIRDRYYLSIRGLNE